MAPGYSSHTALPQRPVSSFILQILPEPLLCARQCPGHADIGEKHSPEQNDRLPPALREPTCLCGRKTLNESISKIWNMLDGDTGERRQGNAGWGLLQGGRPH